MRHCTEYSPAVLSSPPLLVTMPGMGPRAAVIAGLAALLCACATTSGDLAYKRGDLEEAAQIWEDAAGRGDAAAALKLGDLHENYVVKTAESDKALFWYERACQLGNAEGCHDAAEAYQTAHGTPKDLNKAFEYYSKAARKGHVPSQYSVAEMYADGVVKPKNPVDGYKWILLAQDQAQSPFVDDSVRQQVLLDLDGTRERLEKQLTPEQKRRAVAEQKAWRPER